MIHDSLTVSITSRIRFARRCIAVLLRQIFAIAVHQQLFLAKMAQKKRGRMYTAQIQVKLRRRSVIHANPWIFPAYISYIGFSLFLLQVAVPVPPQMRAADT